jgi:hypothetical protein
MMTNIGTVYNGFRLTAIEQPAGGHQIEITPLAGGGKLVLTQTFRKLSDAIDAARRIVDKVLKPDL